MQSIKRINLVYASQIGHTFYDTIRLDNQLTATTRVGDTLLDTATILHFTTPPTLTYTEGELETTCTLTVEVPQKFYEDIYKEMLTHEVGFAFIIMDAMNVSYLLGDEQLPIFEFTVQQNVYRPESGDTACIITFTRTSDQPFLRTLYL